MAVLISMLRGVNVGGKKVPMPVLKEIYNGLKFKNVTTYINSGNVVFSCGTSSLKTISKKLEQKIFEKLGFKVPVIIRAPDEIKSVINKNPFLKEKGINTERLYITFLKELPNKSNLDKTMEYNFEPDRFIIIDKEIYIYCPISYGNSKLNNNFFENKLKVTATTRNLRTTNELLKIASSF